MRPLNLPTGKSWTSVLPMRYRASSMVSAGRSCRRSRLTLERECFMNANSLQVASRVWWEIEGCVVSGCSTQNDSGLEAPVETTQCQAISRSSRRSSRRRCAPGNEQRQLSIHQPMSSGPRSCSRCPRPQYTRSQSLPRRGAGLKTDLALVGKDRGAWVKVRVRWPPGDRSHMRGGSNGPKPRGCGFAHQELGCAWLQVRPM